MSVMECGSFENQEQGLGHGRPLPLGLHPPRSAQQGGPTGAEPGASVQGSDGPALTVVSGAHCSVCPGSSFSCEQSRVVRDLRPQAPRLRGCLQAVLTLAGPSGLSSRSMEEMLSRLFLRLTPAAKGLAMTPGDT